MAHESISSRGCMILGKVENKVIAKAVADGADERKEEKTYPSHVEVVENLARPTSILHLQSFENF